MSAAEKVRVAIIGAGRFANDCRIPNLNSLDAAELTAVCDINHEAAASTAESFDIPKTYENGHEMLEREEFDVLYSIVRAGDRAEGVEAAAASKGIHIFTEKPQALTMDVAKAMEQAIREAGVFSTVGYRERYRPIFQEARRLLEDKKIVHVRFQHFSGLPSTDQGERTGMDGLSDLNCVAIGWGPHAVDYIRFMTGLNIVRAQAFFHYPEQYSRPLSHSFNFAFSTGATATMNFTNSGQGRSVEPYFTIYFEGGYLGVHGYDRIEMNGEVVYEAEEFDPWLEQDRTFIEAIRSGDGSPILSDHADGLYTLAPVLAGWESARINGESIDVLRLLED